jgi:hypothetical protein
MIYLFDSLPKVLSFLGNYERATFLLTSISIPIFSEVQDWISLIFIYILYYRLWKEVFLNPLANRWSMTTQSHLTLPLKLFLSFLYLYQISLFHSLLYYLTVPLGFTYLAYVRAQGYISGWFKLTGFIKLIVNFMMWHSHSM